MIDPYRQFLEDKKALAASAGLEGDPGEINPILKPFQREVVRWAVRGGRRALFESFGLGKTIQQLEILRLILARVGGRGLIVCPLGVRQEFTRDAAMLGTPVTFIRRIEEAGDTGIYVTNYETLRDAKMDPRAFTVISLDEASVLRSFGSKTFGQFLFGPCMQVPHRFVATATPDPNDYLELTAYAAFLGVMDLGESKTRFFKRDSEHADHLTLHPHKEREFWLWVASWAVFLQRPSDLGPEYLDDGYVLPPMSIHWHELPSDHRLAGREKSGQGRLISCTSYGVSEAAREKRHSLEARIEKLMELRAEDPGAHRILWHDLEAERKAIERAIPDVVAVYGNQDLDTREAAIIAFSDGAVAELAAKPVIAGSGTNFQRHCAWAIYLGIGFKFNDFIQSCHRIHRFLQERPVRIDLIYTEAERSIREVLEAKWQRYIVQAQRMSEIIREHGLADIARTEALRRTIGVERAEITGEGYRLVRNDCVEETRAMASDSLHLILTSIPFSSQYEYTPSYHDFGHTDDADHFWRQMDFLTPELLRVLKPGRVYALHVKDRVAPGAMTGLGFQVVQPFHAEAIFHCRRHGFAFLGMKTIVTDVVRENNQTYRLGWTEQCKDGSRMGAGLPEYILIFRKAPTDRSNGYADEPVRKSKAEYPRARWQLDAHGFTRSNGDRLLAPEDLVRLPWKQIYRRYREHSRAQVYDFPHHVACGKALEDAGQLPPDFMLLPPQSWHPDVWTDVTRMRSLNTFQGSNGREKHLCPLPLDIVERLIVQLSMPGEIVYDPFMGLGTVPYVAVKLGRHGWGVELNDGYFRDAAYYCNAAAKQAAVPTLFDLLENAGEDVAPRVDDPDPMRWRGDG